MEQRNKIIFLTLAAILIVCFASLGGTWMMALGKGSHVPPQTYAELIMSQTPVGYWRLGESSGTNIVDATGSNNGTLSGTGTSYSLTGALSGDANTALGFTASGSPSIAMAGATDPTAVTITAWIYYDGSGDESVICRTDGVGSPLGAFSHQLRVQVSGNKVVAYIFDQGTSTAKSVTGTTPLATNTWYHVALAATNGGTLKLYLNGVPEGTPVAINTMWTGGDRWRMVQSTTHPDAAWNGRLDEVAIFYTELSSAQILAQYNKGSPNLGPFPTNGILDNFARADEDPLGNGNWSTLGAGSWAPWQLISNQMVDGSGGSLSDGSYWSASIFAANQEAYVTIATIPNNSFEWIELCVRIQDATINNRDCYNVSLSYLVSGTDQITVNRVDDNVSTQLGATINQDISAGDGIGVSIIGSTITVYYRSGFWGTWSSLGTRTDSTYTGGGSIGLTGMVNNTYKLQRFGGGSL
jgi:hypothetical protein